METLNKGKKMSKTMQEKAAEAHNLCRLKGDSMLDNQERSLAFEAFYDSQSLAEQALAYFIEKARQVENEPCQIQHQFLPTDNGVRLQIWLTFSCQAEVILFQMVIR